MKKDIPVFNHEKFLSKLKVNQGTQCWEYMGTLVKGYGRVEIRINKIQKHFLAHRLSYSIFNNDIRSDLVIDHMCMNKSCCNPDHLRQVSNRTNSLENSTGVSYYNSIKTKCIRGHYFDETNTRIASSGQRVCRTCDKTRDRKKYREYVSEYMRNKRKFEKDNPGIKYSSKCSNLH